MPRPLDWTGNQVREQTDEKTIIEEGLRGLDPPFIDVHDIGDFRKRVKRNAWRKEDTNEGQRDIVNSKFCEGHWEGARTEAKVSEDPQNHAIQDEPEVEPLPPIA